MVKGLSAGGAARLVAARDAAAFINVQDMARRAALDRGDLNSLAHAGALTGLAGHRRNALWQVTGVEAPVPVLAVPTREAQTPELRQPSEGQDIVADYQSVGLTLGRHPLALIRPLLRQRRLATAIELRGYRHGQLARASGIVTHRQRPDTAKGVIFITLEDETGHVNVVVWSRVAEMQRVEMLGAKLLTVYGTWETDGKVHHLIAGRLRDDSALLGQLTAASRDFR
jgi:error-prone DNA polymerase